MGLTYLAFECQFHFKIFTTDCWFASQLFSHQRLQQTNSDFSILLVQGLFGA